MILLEDQLFFSQFDWKGLSTLRGCLLMNIHLNLTRGFIGIVLNYSKVGDQLYLLVLTPENKIIPYETKLYRCRLV